MNPQEQVGRVLVGKYEVVSVLGVGGMGVVLRARHVALGEEVAVKLLSRELVGREEYVSRFYREARAAARIKSEHVARVIDVGSTEEGVPFLVMELLEGEDLEVYLTKRGGALAPGEAARLVLEACDAIAEAHELGIVHRDIKPANLFLARRGRGPAKVKVLDFGISKMAGDAGSATRTSAIMGSPAYMSPEQLRSTRDVDGRTDVWSLGAVLFELCAGRIPFEGESVADITAGILRGERPRLAEHLPDAPPGFADLVDACLERELELRVPSVAEFARRLEPYAATEPSAPRSVVQSATPSLRTDDERITSSTAIASTVHSASPLSLPGAGTHATVEVDSRPERRAVRSSGMKVALGVGAIGLLALVAGHRVLGGGATRGVTGDTSASAASAEGQPSPSDRRSAPERADARATEAPPVASVDTRPGPEVVPAASGTASALAQAAASTSSPPAVASAPRAPVSSRTGAPTARAAPSAAPDTSPASELPDYGGRK